MKAIVNLDSRQVVKRDLTASESTARTNEESVLLAKDAVIAAEVSKQQAREKALEALIDEEAKKGGVAPKDLRDYVALKKAAK